ncbi:MAG: hypothetical protein CL910_13800 [Deltaproteobacteria bacterium]|jgi:curved DNA-binding protein CbpA|nr:hypothetical protein [Deltaproteobacteria bacterium]
MDCVPSGEAQGEGQARPRQTRRDLPQFELEIDESLDLDPKIQEELIEFVGGLSRPYHEILGVAPDADTRAIKKAYFQKSKRFHPDRYFRKNLGEYEAVIDTCFKRLLEAYELLSDPATRAEVQKSETSSGSATGDGPSSGDAATGSSKTPRVSGAVAARRLRRRMSGLQGHKKIRQERKQKAKSFFESGIAAFRGERWLEAAGSVRLAIAFDPDNEVYREEFGKVQRKAHEMRAAQLQKQADAAMDLRDLGEAFSHLEEAFHYRPFDGELAFRAAQLAWQVVGDLHKAKDLASSACELEPENGAYHRVLGQIYKAAGLAANAKRELETAVRLKDKEAKAELRGL